MGNKPSVTATITGTQHVTDNNADETLYSIAVKIPAATNASFGNENSIDRSYTIHKRSDEFHTLAKELRNAYGNSITVPMSKSTYGYNSWLQSILSNQTIANAHQVREWLAEQLQDYNADEDDDEGDDKHDSHSNESSGDRLNQHDKPIMRNSVMHLQTVQSSTNLSDMNLDKDKSTGQQVAYNILKDFTLLKVIGKGSFGKVMLVRQNSTSRIFAMKVLHKEQVIKRNQVEHTRTERSVMGYVKHPFIVRLRYAFQSRRKLYLVMDYYAGGELFFHLGRAGRFSEGRAKFYAAQIVSALEYIHSKSVVYRDLKPENVLLDANGYIALTDFGLSKEGISDNKSANSFCGTPEYLAPEILTRSGHGRASDWWSLGALLFEMLTGMPPFYSRNRDRLFQKILNSELKFPRFLSDEARDLLQRLLDRNPDTRLGSTGDAEDIKSHPWFASIDWDALLSKKIQPPFKPHVALPTDTANFDQEFTSLPLDSIGSSLGKSLLMTDSSKFMNAANQQSSDENQQQNGTSNIESQLQSSYAADDSEESNKFAGFSYVTPAEYLMSPPDDNNPTSVLSSAPEDRHEQQLRQNASTDVTPKTIELDRVHRQVSDLEDQNEDGAGEI